MPGLYHQIFRDNLVNSQHAIVILLSKSQRGEELEQLLTFQIRRDSSLHALLVCYKGNYLMTDLTFYF